MQNLLKCLSQFVHSGREVNTNNHGTIKRYIDIQKNKAIPSRGYSITYSQNIVEV